MKPTYKIIATIAGLSLTVILTASAEEQNEGKKPDGKQAPAQQHPGNVQHAAKPQVEEHQNNVAHTQNGPSTTHHNNLEHTVNAPTTMHQNNMAPVENAQAMTHHNNVEHAATDHGQAASNVDHAHPSQLDHTSNQSLSVQQNHAQHVNPQESQVAANGSGGYQSHSQNSSGQNVSNQPGGNAYRSAGAGGAPQANQPGGNQSGNPGAGGQYSQPQITPNNQYNSGNNYGGNWSAASTHGDWNHSGQHYWNNNNYMWYQGGWLIITSAFNPFYVNSGYSNYGSAVSSVQTSLANRGYYNGPIDGNLGPGTRNAIASYQNDNNLNVTGHINGALLQSLQIQ